MTAYSYKKLVSTKASNDLAHEYENYNFNILIFISKISHIYNVKTNCKSADFISSSKGNLKLAKPMTKFASK